MPGVGYYSGLLEGMKGVAGIQHEQLSSALLAEEIPFKRLQYQEELDKLRTQQTEKKLLQQAFASGEGFRAGNDEQASLNNQASKLYRIGQALMGVNPKDGLAFIKEAEDIQRKGYENQSSIMNARKAQLEVVGGIFTGIGSQEDLDAAIPELARNGKVIPPKYRQWNPETAAWIEKQSRVSKIGRDDINLDLRTKRAQLQEEELARKKANDENIKQHRASMEQLARDRLQKGKAYKAPSTKETDYDIARMSENEEFSDLPGAEKLRVAQDLESRAYELVQQGVSPTAAKYAAEEEVLSRIKDGKYEGFKDSLPKGGPSLDEFLAKAKVANPGVSEADLKKYYEDTYGNR